jgi:hypothetical protein
LGHHSPFVVFLAIRPRAQLSVTVAAILILCLALGVAALGLSFTNVFANFVGVAVVFIAYYFLAASCLQIPFRVIRYLALTVAILPICFGYVLGTIGMLGLVWMVMDYTEPPQHAEQVGPHLKCEITGWGAAGTASGYTVHLYKTWPEVPFIVREVVSLRVIQAGYVGEPPADKTCSDAVNVYSR